MLSNHEQRELQRIEEELLADARLSACFSRLRKPHSVNVGLLGKVLVVAGSLIMMAAAFLDLSETVVQGLGLLVVGVTIWAYRGSAPAADPRAQGRTPERGTESTG